MDLPKDIQTIVGEFLTPYWVDVIERRWEMIPDHSAYRSAILCNSMEMLLWLREGPRLPWSNFEINLMGYYNNEMLWEVLKWPDSPKGKMFLARAFSFNNDVSSLEILAESGIYTFNTYCIIEAIKNNSLEAIQWLLDPLTGNGNVVLPFGHEFYLGAFGNIETFQYFYNEVGSTSAMRTLLIASKYLKKDPSREVLISYLKKRFSMEFSDQDLENNHSDIHWIYSEYESDRNDLLWNRYVKDMTLRYGKEDSIQEILREIERTNKLDNSFYKLIIANNLEMVQYIYRSLNNSPPGWSRELIVYAEMHECVDIIRWIEEVCH